MDRLPQLFAKNRAWSERVRAGDPEFFARLARQQTPQYLWIGCADSRVPANEVVGLAPGELFVHRNIANVVIQTDLNCLSVLQFAVDLLKIEHVIVCGHYGCSGVRASLAGLRVGLSDNWLRKVEQVYDKHQRAIDGLHDETEKLDRLCELNVVEQVLNVARTTVVQDAWTRGQPLTLHGWVYGLRDGLLRDLGPTVSSAEALLPTYRDTVVQLTGRTAQ